MVGCMAATARQRGASALILVGAEPSYDETEEREERSQPACQVMICAQPQPSLVLPCHHHHHHQHHIKTLDKGMPGTCLVWPGSHHHRNYQRKPGLQYLENWKLANIPEEL